MLISNGKEYIFFLWDTTTNYIRIAFNYSRFYILMPTILPTCLKVFTIASSVRVLMRSYRFLQRHDSSFIPRNRMIKFCLLSIKKKKNHNDDSVEVQECRKSYRNVYTNFFCISPRLI